MAQVHARGHGLEVLQTYQHALKGYAAEIPASQLDKVRSDDEVLFVSENREVRASAQSTPTGIQRIGSEPSTTRTNNGRGVGVAVIDTGIDLTHPDLSGVRNGTNCIDPSKDATDDHGHGSHVAGTIAARNDDRGVVGVAPEATPYAVKVLNSNGSGSFASVICGIDWVTSTRTDSDSTNDIGVANMSLGGSGSDDGNCGDSNSDAMHRAICNSVAAGVTYAVAAGNDGSNLAAKVPAAYDEVATVTALADFDGKPGGGAPSTCRSDVDDTAADFSNYTTPGSADEGHTIAAPGVCIKSTWPSTLGDKSGYNTISGTSMATPHVAGTAALYVANDPGATPTEVIAALREDAGLKSDPAANPYYGFADDPNRSSNASRYYGYLEWPGGYFGNTNPLRVIDVSPDDGATGVVLRANVTATFSEAMDPATLTPSTFTLAKDGSTAPVDATVSYDAATRKVTLNPSVDLEPGVKYTATVEGGADCTSCAKDEAGTPLAADKVWSFTTTDDITPPTVIDVSPDDGAARVAFKASVTATFSEDVRQATLTPSTFTLVKDGGTAPVDATVSYDAATRKVTLDPSANLEINTKYTATVKGGADGVKDKVGNPLAADMVWSFTTTDDTTPPTVIETSPAAGQENVARDTNVTVKFPEEMDRATLTRDTFMLARGSDEPTPETKITLGTTVRYDPATRTATLDPYGDSSRTMLAKCARYTAKLTSDVTDKAGNPLDQDPNISGNQPVVWTFKTRGC